MADHLAWIPNDSASPPLNEGLDLAVTWVIGQAAARSAHPCLVTESFDSRLGWAPLDRLFERGVHVTRRSQTQLTPDTGAFLVFGPDEELFELGLRLAEDRPLCVIEFYPFPIDGWARTVQAVDLTTHSVLQPFGPDVLEKLERVLSYGQQRLG